MRRAGGMALLAAVALASCADEQERSPSVAGNDNRPSSAQGPAAPEERILAEGGLAGLQLLPEARLESPATTMRLFEAAYADDASASGAFVREGVHYDARPAASFRSGDKLVLLVNHASDEQIHADSGSTSVFYFNADGSGPVRSYRESIPGSSWGTEAGIRLIVLSGHPAALSGGGGTWQGYTCGSDTITLFGPGGASTSPTFPSYYDDSGADGGTSVSLTGAELTPDGGGLTLLYTGREAGEDGSPRPVSLRQSLRFDGRGAEWIQSWPYRC